MLNLTRLGLQAFLGAIAIQMVSSLMGTAVASIAPEVARGLSADSTFAGLYIGCLYVGACLSSLCGGNFIRRFGPAHISEWALFLAAGAILLCMSSWEIVVLFSAFLLGLAKGPLMPAINTMLSRQVDKKDYNIIFSLKQCAGPIGMALSGLVIPLLTSHFGWRVGLAFVVCLAVIVGFWSAFIKKSQDSSYQFKDEPISLEHLADSLKLVVSSKLLTRLSVVSIFYKGIQMSVLAYLVVFLNDQKFSLVFAGAALATSNFGGIFGRIGWGAAAQKFGSSRKVLALIGVLMGLFTAMLGFIDQNTPEFLVLGLCLLIGINTQGWSGVFFAQIAAWAPEGKVAEATGGVDFFSFPGAIFLPMTFGFLGHHLGEFVTGFWVISVITVATGVYLWLVSDAKGTPA